LYADSPEDYSMIKSNLNFIDEEEEKKRIEFNLQKKKTEEFNENLKIIWDGLKDLEKLKFFCKENFLKEFEEIIEKGKTLNLSDEKIKEIIVQNSSNILTENCLFGFIDILVSSLREIPFRHVKEEGLTFLITNKISNHLKCPEKLIVDNFTLDQLTNEQVTSNLKLYFIDQFKEYWEIIQKETNFKEIFTISKI
jgi:hypothetical protein